MRIGIDIDDTITDSYIDIVGAYSAYSNVDKDMILNNKVSYKDLHNTSVYPRFREFTIKYFEKIMPHVKLKSNVKEVIDILHNLGFEIEIVTARTLCEYDDPYKMSYDYLTKNNIYFDKLIVGVCDKGLYCKTHNIDVLIDDSIKNLRNAKKYGIKTILFGNIFNEDNQEFKRANSWVEILNMLTTAN